VLALYDFMDTKKGTTTAAANEQRSHFFAKGHRSAVPLGLDPEDYLGTAMQPASAEGFSMDGKPITLADLKRAAEGFAVRCKDLPEARQKWHCAVKELAYEQPLSERLSLSQAEPSVEVAIIRANIGMLTNAVIIMSWLYWKLLLLQKQVARPLARQSPLE